MLPIVEPVTSEEEPLRVGVVGAGPWARFVHAPMFAHHPGVKLVGVWGRRVEAAEEVAHPHGAVGLASYDELLSRVDALSFAVPPDVQASMASVAAEAGKALLLEKPIALDLGLAQSLADVVQSHDVPTQMVLTWRYADHVRRFLDQVAAAPDVVGARGQFLAGAMLGGMFATPWRLEEGPLMDLGPHVIDLLDVALGPVIGIRAHGDPLRWVGLLLDHEGGAVSEASLSSVTGIEPARAGVEVFTRDRLIDVDTTGLSAEVLPRIVDEFVVTATTRASHPLDLRRGLHLQRLLTNARASLP